MRTLCCRHLEIKQAFRLHPGAVAQLDRRCVQQCLKAVSWGEPCAGILQHQRHAVVDRCHAGVGGRGQNGEGAPVADAGQHAVSAISAREGVPHLVPVPFIEALHGHGNAPCQDKLPKKDLSWVSNLGWAIAVVAMYLLALNLVIHENISLVPVFALIGVAFVLVLLFGGMSPDLTFGQGLKAGLANAFTDFLDTISCFGNVMSYIRLFAVGMAGVAISQSFNGIAAGMHGPLIILGVVVVLIGHALNIIMCFLSVVVHGVRLNVLEFSGQVGLEWTGLPYEPFKKLNK